MAARLGEDGDGGERRLGRALAATAVAGLSMLCLLVGAGSWIAHSPPPTWFPWATPWHAPLVAVGLGLCPLWVRLGFRG